MADNTVPIGVFTQLSKDPEQQMKVNNIQGFLPDALFTTPSFHCVAVRNSGILFTRKKYLYSLIS